MTKLMTRKPKPAPPDAKDHPGAAWQRFLAYFCRVEGFLPNERGITARLAAKLGLPDSTVRQWVDGTATLGYAGWPALTRIATAYPLLNWTWFLTGEGEPDHLSIPFTALTERQRDAIQGLSAPGSAAAAALSSSISMTVKELLAHLERLEQVEAALRPPLGPPSGRTEDAPR